MSKVNFRLAEFEEGQQIRNDCILLKMFYNTKKESKLFTFLFEARSADI